jgi:iron complex outermembrane receptor protein
VPNVPPAERVDLAHSEGTIPRWRATVTLPWSRNGVSASATARYTAAYADASAGAVRNGRTVRPPTLVDVQATLDFGAFFETGSGAWRGMQLRLGIINLFDREPAYSEVGSGYDPTQADLRQRFGYLSLTKTF